ncbi:uncharacterized protein LOC122000740 [Zingiber officinale]|uniref:uncharacterized protein LOC122000740 n=1 Tax=Zingiber officinale TaxID=94328 RepID=UPI001C4B80C5|nr:uncharacterized protein LOC122000740 [Zingiber officinale]
MPLVACRPAQALILSGFKYLPLRSSSLPHLRLSSSIAFSIFPSAPVPTSITLFVPNILDAFFYSRQPRRDMAADGAVGVAASQDDVLTKRLQYLQSKLEAIGIMGNDWKLGVGLSIPCPKALRMLSTEESYLRIPNRII